MKPDFTHNVTLDPTKTERVVSEEFASKSSAPDKEMIQKQLSLLSKGMAESKMVVQSGGTESNEPLVESPPVRSPVRTGEPLKPPYKIPDE